MMNIYQQEGVYFFSAMMYLVTVMNCCNKQLITVNVFPTNDELHGKSRQLDEVKLAAVQFV